MPLHIRLKLAFAGGSLLCGLYGAFFISGDMGEGLLPVLLRDAAMAGFVLGSGWFWFWLFRDAEITIHGLACALLACLLTGITTLVLWIGLYAYLPYRAAMAAEYGAASLLAAYFCTWALGLFMWEYAVDAFCHSRARRQQARRLARLRQPTG